MKAAESLGFLWFPYPVPGEGLTIVSASCRTGKFI